jgi:hypothetical protein
MHLKMRKSSFIYGQFSISDFIGGGSYTCTVLSECLFFSTKNVLYVQGGGFSCLADKIVFPITILRRNYQNFSTDFSTEKFSLYNIIDKKAWEQEYCLYTFMMWTNTTTWHENTIMWHENTTTEYENTTTKYENTAAWHENTTTEHENTTTEHKNMTTEHKNMLIQHYNINTKLK